MRELFLEMDLTLLEAYKICKEYFQAPTLSQNHKLSLTEPSPLGLLFLGLFILWRKCPSFGV